MNGFTLQGPRTSNTTENKYRDIVTNTKLDTKEYNLKKKSLFFTFLLKPPMPSSGRQPMPLSTAIPNWTVTVYSVLASSVALDKVVRNNLKFRKRIWKSINYRGDSVIRWMIRILFTSSRNKWGRTIVNSNFRMLFLLWLKVLGGFQMNLSGYCQFSIWKWIRN